MYGGFNELLLSKSRRAPFAREVEIVEPWVTQGLRRGDALTGLVNQHPLQELETERVKFWNSLSQRDFFARAGTWT